MSIGNNSSQTNSSVFDYDIVSGLDGDDTLNGTHNGVILLGGRGDDVFSTNYTVTTEFATQTQLGGDGNDTMNLSVDGGNATGSSVLNGAVDGGRDDDIIDAEFYADSLDNTVVRSQVNGGIGMDQISARNLAIGGNSADTEQVVDAGGGDDSVAAYSGSGVSSAINFANIHQVVDLGGGNDTLTEALAENASSGTNQVKQEIFGGGGDDVMRGVVTVSHDFLGPLSGGTTIIQLMDGGTGADSIESQINTLGSSELDFLSSTATIIGGNGLDVIASITDLTAKGAMSTANATHNISSGRDEDSITIDHDLAATGVGGLADLANNIAMGLGDDTLNADTDIADSELGTITNNVNAISGFNDLTVHGQVLVDRFAEVRNDLSTGDKGDVIDADAFAFVVSTGVTVADHVADARNYVVTDGGNDDVTVGAQAQSSGDGSGGAPTGNGAYALNNVRLGTGSDTLDSGTFVFSDSFGGSGLGEVFIEGDTGKDVINSLMSSDFSELFDVRFDSFIDGGDANDTITSSIDGFARNTIEIASVINGGSGGDMIMSTIITESFGTATQTVDETINGGGGADTITTVFDSSQTPALTGPQPDLVINGDAGNDVINATIIGDEGTFDINGGADHDSITITSPFTSGGVHQVTGGTGNDTITGSDDWDVISGDAGKDRLVASGGSDELWGGANGGTGDGQADTFVFDPAAASLYFTELEDFEFAFDILEFTGLTDNGAAGLADDIDALGTITDNGLGNDVDFVLFLGGSLTFTGAGTGSVSSIADLVSDEFTQLIA